MHTYTNTPEDSLVKSSLTKWLAAGENCQLQWKLDGMEGARQVMTVSLTITSDVYRHFAENKHFCISFVMHSTIPRPLLFSLYLLPLGSILRKPGTVFPSTPSTSGSVMTFWHTDWTCDGCKALLIAMLLYDFLPEIFWQLLGLHNCCVLTTPGLTFDGTISRE